MFSSATPASVIFGSVAFGVLVLILWLFIWWAIIRSAVLSALRKHHKEMQPLEMPLYRGD